MKEKHLFTMGGVFLVLLIIYFVTKPRMATVNYDDIVQTVIFGVSKEDVKEIDIYKQTAAKEARMQFIKQGDQWYLPTKFNAKVRDYSINRIIEDLLEMTGKVRTSDPKHQETFKITDEQGIHVILKDAAQKPLANLIIGKKGEDYSAGFVRFSGKDKIYAVDKNILTTLSIYGEVDTLTQFNDKSFIDLNAVKLDKKDFKLAALVANNKEMVIKRVEREIKIEPKPDETATEDTTRKTKKEYEWVLLKGAREIKLDQKEVDKFFSETTNINAQEIVDRIGNTLADFSKSASYRFDRPTHYIVFIKEDNSKYNIIFGKEFEKEKGYFMNVQYDNLIYKVVKSKFDAIFKWVDELPKKLPAKEEKKT